ncbi:Tumor necrosis factor receptor superfamily member 19 [Dissostichus eleginoides]|uniref:Tumor necrosis factor receptor superfamily member 19 n=1 Tax=Dissostichus eleginoides TaxID=100907 RepID=A0AAD9CE20_DISEL|nr:Tumor necrosis factor receptor superfamily member 19 [Dissostichus eleginoides]
MFRILQHTFSLLLTVHVIYSALIPVGAEEETRECREQEYKDRFGSCRPCKQCDAGQELSKVGSGRVNLVPLPPVVTSPRDMALAAVICSALATVLLALLVLCVIYCKRQLLEKKPSAASLRSQDCPYSGAELSCLDPRWLHDFPQRPCCRCHLGPGHTCDPVHLIPSLCCEESCSLGRSLDVSAFPSQTSLSDGNTHQDEEAGYPESGCREAAGMRGAPEPAESVEHGEEEERCRSRENSPERSRRSYSEAVTDALLPKQQASSQDDTIKCSHLFEMPPAVLTSEPLLTGSEYSMYIHANKSTAEESTGAQR